MPFRGRAKWGAVAFDLALAGVGALLAWGVFAQVPDEVVVMWTLALYTVYAAAVTVVLALARAATRQLPTLRRATLDGEEAWLLRAWPGEWWHALALDLGLSALAAVVAALGLRAGGDWVVPSLVVAATGVWFLGRAGLALAGARRHEALWLTADAVIHDSGRGRARCPCTRVAGAAGSRGGSRLLLLLDGPPELRACPRPWRRRVRRTTPDSILVDCSGMGHDAADLAQWIRSGRPWA